MPATPGHDLIPNNVDEPSHSHFAFTGVVIQCALGGQVTAAANGGNDGHIIDDYRNPTTTPPAQYPFGNNTDPLEDDGVVGNCTYDHDVNQGDGRHHGSMTESGWSHSANYLGAGGPSQACGPGNEADTAAGGPNGGTGPGACRPGPNKNKANGVVGPQGPNDFVKYYRFGNVVAFWGCDNDLGGASGFGGPRFSGVLAITPDPATPGFPVCVLPGPPNCNLILVGGSLIGTTWAPPPVSAS